VDRPVDAKGQTIPVGQGVSAKVGALCRNLQGHAIDVTGPTGRAVIGGGDSC
jgi:hypothetical protein